MCHKSWCYLYRYIGMNRQSISWRIYLSLKTEVCEDSVSYYLKSFPVISCHMGIIWYDIWYRIVIWYTIWDEMISYGIVSYHIQHGYELSWVRVVLGTSCLGYELSCVRVVLGTSCRWYELSWVRVVLGTSCPGYELSWVRVVQIPIRSALRS